MEGTQTLHVYIGYRDDDNRTSLSYETTDLHGLTAAITYAARSAGLAVEEPPTGGIDIYSMSNNCSHKEMRTLVEWAASEAQRRITNNNLARVQNRNREFHADIAG